MRRPINWLVVVISLVFLVFGLAATGCSGGTGNTADGMLRPVRDAAELESTLKAAIRDYSVTGWRGDPADLPAAPTVDYSGTYTVEEGVDELDSVRYDGNRLFVAVPAKGPAQPTPVIRILRTHPDTATAMPVGSIALDATVTVLGMYTSGDRLFVVTGQSFFGTFGDLWGDIAYWAPTSFGVEVHDVQDSATPRRLLKATIDGVFVASRRIDDRIIIVSRHAPRAVMDPQQMSNLGSVPLAELLPAIDIDGARKPLVEPRHCFLGSEATDRGHAVITSISTFSLAVPSRVDGVCYGEAADGVYASREAVYVSEPRFDSQAGARTRVHKFRLDGARPDYSGSAEIPGMLWSDGQEDFRMSESAGLLRVMTTESTGDTADSLDHRLFVLKPKSGEAALEIIGRLPNEQRPEEIGKPNESLFAVRFMDERAYAVTFERVDPLYVIDLSSPADPRIAGQLQLPGFSQLLHPVTEDLLLGLGSDAGRFKLELFDTSVLELPQSRGAITIPGLQSRSEVLRNRHALAYLPELQADRFAVPVEVFDASPGNDPAWSASLGQFEILGKQTPAAAQLLEAGSIVAAEAGAPTYFSPSRAFIDGDTVYYVRDGQVWGSSWDSPSQVNGPF